MSCCAVSNSAGLGGVGNVAGMQQQIRRGREPLILSSATFKVPVTSWLAALLKPMWLSLICTKLKPECMLRGAPAAAPSLREQL
jgi:hypothetical protein